MHALWCNRVISVKQYVGTQWNSSCSSSAPRVRKSRYWGQTHKVPHPLLWCNKASLLVQWQTMYFPLALWTLVCVHRVLSAHQPVLLCAQNTSIRRHTDVVDSSNGRSYVTEQWHNVPLLRTRGLHIQKNWVQKGMPVTIYGTVQSPETHCKVFHSVVEELHAYRVTAV